MSPRSQPTESAVIDSASDVVDSAMGSISKWRRDSPSSASSTCRDSRSASRLNTVARLCSVTTGRGRCEPLPSAALVDLLAEFDVNPSGARAALSRLSIRGLLVGTKDGRNTFYRVADGFRHLLPYGPIHTLAFAKPKPDWDGMWTMVAFTVPEDQRRLRPMLRGRLQSLGFAPLYDGLWVSPHAPDQELDIALEVAPPRSCTVIRATELAVAHSAGGRLGVEPRRARRLVRRIHSDVSTRSAPPRTRPDRAHRSAGQSHALDLSMVRVCGHGSRPAKGVAATSLAAGGGPRPVCRLVDGLASPAVERVREIVSKYDRDLGKLVALTKCRVSEHCP